MKRENKNITIIFLEAFMIFICVYMTFLVYDTSMRSNLWQILPELNKQPWFNTTVIDFYFNIAIISIWVIYKENHLGKSLLWIVAFVCLGSIATAFYVFLQLRHIKDGQSFEKILLRK